MKAQDMINIAKNIATNYKTLYVYGCFGAPLNSVNKNRYTHNYKYNEQTSRRNKINSASSDTFGFDCVNLLKGILWGWNGNKNATYGGAKYVSNHVPDTNANGLFWDYCYEQSKDFNTIIPGEFVWLEGHIGLYIGDSLVVECTPIWKDGVQITTLKNKSPKSGYNQRTWTAHGKSKFLDYEPPKPTPVPGEKYKVGDKVIIDGQLYGNADGGNPGQVVHNRVTTITRVAKGHLYPYNTTGDLGWMAEACIKPYTEELKVGDSVIIQQPGNSSSLGNGAKAYGIGWTRKILRIYINKPYPYQVGDSTGTTGFYKAEALKKI